MIHHSETNEQNKTNKKLFKKLDENLQQISGPLVLLRGNNIRYSEASKGGHTSVISKLSLESSEPSEPASFG